MNRAFYFFLFSLCIPITSWSAGIEYYEYLKKTINNAENIKSKEELVNAEDIKKLSSQLYFVPKLSASSTPKKTKSSSKDQYVESKLTLSSLLFDDTVFRQIDINDYKLQSSIIDLKNEKSKVIASIMGDQINITMYEKLRAAAVKLKNEAESLYKKIDMKYNYGIIKESDVQLAKLLVQKINTEIDSIDHNVDRLKLNIEASSLEPYPLEGIHIGDYKINELLCLKNEKSKIVNNFDLKKIKINMSEAKLNAMQQNSHFSVSLIADRKWNNSALVNDDTYVGLKFAVNIFDLDNHFSELSGVNEYKALSFNYDYKYKLLQNQLKVIELNTTSNKQELNNLEKQFNTTQALIKNQEKEYGINQVSVYEMLNTRFDLFQIEQKISDIKSFEARNKIDLLQLYGGIITFFVMDGRNEKCH